MRTVIALALALTAAVSSLTACQDDADSRVSSCDNTGPGPCFSPGGTRTGAETP